ncbi:MAG: putative porin, partial [Bacteroidota bacterium]
RPKYRIENLSSSVDSGSHVYAVPFCFQGGIRFGISVGAHTTPGDFSRQLSSGRRFMLVGAYNDTNSRYAATMNYRFFRIFNEENGGISSDSSFESATRLDTRTLPVFLQKAGVYHRQNQYNVDQSFAIRKSTSSTPGWSLYHKLSLNRSSFVFYSENPDSGYFNTFFVDSTATYDSTFHQRMNNQFGLKYSKESGKSSTAISAGVWLENSKYEINGFDALSYNQLMMQLLFDFSNEKSSASLHWLQSLDSLSEINTLLSTETGNYGKLKLQLRYRSERPSENVLYYISNHFAWINTFENTKSLYTDFAHVIPKWELEYGMEVAAVNGLVFYREDALPQQYEKQIGYGKVYATKIFKLHKFGSTQRIDYAFSGNQNVIRIPDFNYFGSVYYRNLLFKKALDLKVGFDLTYWLKDYSYGYMPATGVFYLQDNRKTGGFTMFGAFADLKIKTAILTIRLDHLNAGIGNREYYGSWRYPLQGRTLKIGVKWDLAD